MTSEAAYRAGVLLALMGFLSPSETMRFICVSLMGGALASMLALARYEYLHEQGMKLVKGAWDDRPHP